jgi:tripartite-type tricarboxylate transporter receptor subunit TctC
MKHLRCCLIVCALVLSFSATTARAETAAEFYSRNNIRMVISTDPGGNYDSVARLVGRHLGKHIRGNPKIVPENTMGASGRVAANYMYRLAPQDGSVIAVVQQSIAMGQAIGESGVQYDATRFNWIGSPVRPDEVLVVWHTASVRTIEDAKKTEVTIGATSPTGMNYVYPRLANELLGTRFKIISGYQGATHINLAMERGEVEGRGSCPWAEWKTDKPEWVADKKIIPLMQMSLVKHPDLPDVPLMIDLARTDDVRKVIELISITGEIGRPLLTGPAVPADRVTALRRAFDETMDDPEFLADAAKAMRDIEPIKAPELESLVAIGSCRSCRAISRSS